MATTRYSHAGNRAPSEVVETPLNISRVVIHQAARGQISATGYTRGCFHVKEHLQTTGSLSTFVMA